MNLQSWSGRAARPGRRRRGRRTLGQAAQEAADDPDPVGAEEPQQRQRRRDVQRHDVGQVERRAAVARVDQAVDGLSRGEHAGQGDHRDDEQAAEVFGAAVAVGVPLPGILIVVAGAVPVGLPLHEHTWETFSLHWHADVKIAFGWLKAALRPAPERRRASTSPAWASR